MNTNLNLGAVLGSLGSEDFVQPDGNWLRISRLTTEQREPQSPWFVRLFVGFSAWIASILLIVFLGMANVLQDQHNMVFIGLLACAFSVGLNRFGPRNDFTGQFALAFSLTGQILFAFGVAAWVPYDQDNRYTVAILTVIALECLLIWLYRDPVQRFISTLVITGGILWNIYDLHILEATHILIFALAALLFLLSWAENNLLSWGLEEVASPVASGLAVCLLGLLILPLNNFSEIRMWWITAVLLVMILLFLALELRASLGANLLGLNSIWIVLGCAVVLIPALRMPGILGAAIVLLIGFWRGNRFFIGLAAAFMVFYLSSYYYFLEWSLLNKSIALICTGAILFLVRYGLSHLKQGGVA